MPYKRCVFEIRQWFRDYYWGIIFIFQIPYPTLCDTIAMPHSSFIAWNTYISYNSKFPFFNSNFRSLQHSKTVHLYFNCTKAIHFRHFPTEFRLEIPRSSTFIDRKRWYFPVDEIADKMSSELFKNSCCKKIRWPGQYSGRKSSLLYLWYRHGLG